MNDSMNSTFLYVFESSPILQEYL